MNGTARDVARPRLRTSRLLFDGGAVLLTVAALGLPRQFGGVVALTPASGVLLGLAIVVMLVRRRFPRTAVAVTVILTTAALTITGALASHLVGVLVGVFTLGKLTTRRSTIAAGVSTIVVLWAASLLILGPEITDIRAIVQIVGSVGFAAAAGDASRSRRAYIGEITERARLAEESKEAEARRRVADERVAIARDLHDLVAHQIAVVSLNAGVASRALPARPADAEDALKTIRDAAQTVLGEIGGLLTVLRAGESEPPSGLRRPNRTLAELPELLTDFESSGLAVALRTEGAAVPLPPAVDAIAYWAVQESLTNALKHTGGHEAPRTASVLLDYQPHTLTVTVINPVTVERLDPAATSRGGHGLDGVRERVASVHGQLLAGPESDATFRFQVSLPTQSG